MKRLAVAYMLAGEAAATVNALRQQHDPRTAAAIAAHVTLAGPSDSPTAVSDIEAALADCSLTTEPFEFTIAGVDTFLPASAVCYLKVEPAARVVAFHDLLLTALHWQEEFPYVPHLTVAEYLTAEATAAVAACLELLNMCEREVVNALTLLEKAPDGRWMLLREFLLAGTQHRRA